MSDEIPSEYRFDLKHSRITYSSGGDQVPASHVVLTAPTSRHSKECAYLKQAFFRASKGGDAEAGSGAEFKQPDGAEMVILLSMADNVELPEVLEVAKRLLTSGVAMVDGSAKLTSHLLDQLHQDDFEELVGEYLVNFILASALEKMKRASSEASSTS